MPESIPLALWLIPLLVFAMLAGLLLISRYLRQQAEQELKKLRLALRQFQAGRKEIELRAGAYSGRDPEPYRTQSTSLRELLAALRRKSEALERQAIDLNEQAASLKFNRWRAMLGAPYLWHFLRRDAARLQAELAQLAVELEEAARIETSMERLSWEVAGQARDLRLRAQDASQLLAELGARGLHGDTFEAAAGLEREVQTALAQVPRSYFKSPEADLLAEATKETTALVHEIVRFNRPRLDELLGQARLWEAECQATAEKTAALRQSLDELQATLTSLPAAIEIAEEQAALRQLEEVAQNLQAAASRLEVESIPLVAQEAQRLRQAAYAKSQELKQARRALASFETLLGELAEGFREYSLQLAALGSRAIHPVQWDLSLQQLAALNRQANDLGRNMSAGRNLSAENVRQTRTPVQVSADLGAAAAISARQKELGRHIQEVGLAHSELAALLESDENKRMTGWVQAARSLAAQAGEYAPENFPRPTDLAGLPAALDALSGEVERLLAGDLSIALPETQVAGRLEQVRKLAEEGRRLADRVASLRQRFEDLKRAEDLANDQLQGLQKSLTAIHLIVNSNQFLAGSASSEIDRYLKNVQDLQKELDQPERGAVEKKARQAALLVERLEASSKRWLELLDKENQTLLKELASSLAELDAIARLEDASVAEARRLLSAGQPDAGDHPAGRKRFDLADAPLEFKRRSSFWQELTASQKALENVHQLVETYREAGFQREQVLGLAKSTDGWIDQGGRRASERVWPPAAATLDAERRDLETLEAEWEALKTRSGKAIALVAQYGSLASRYQNLAERIRQNAARRQQERSQVAQLEEEIVQLAEPWENLLAQHRDNPTASREIHELLDDLDERMEDIERAYLRGELDYGQVIQEMKAVQRRVRYYQIALDDENALDATGRVIRRRQSERNDQF
jgi:hypothetical protein